MKRLPISMYHDSGFHLSNVRQRRRRNPEFLPRRRQDANRDSAQELQSRVRKRSRAHRPPPYGSVSHTRNRPGTHTTAQRTVVIVADSKGALDALDINEDRNERLQRRTSKRPPPPPPPPPLPVSTLFVRQRPAFDDSSRKCDRFSVETIAVELKTPPDVLEKRRRQ